LARPDDLLAGSPNPLSPMTWVWTPRYMVETLLMARRKCESDCGMEVRNGAELEESGCCVELSPFNFCTRRAKCMCMYRDLASTGHLAEDIHGVLHVDSSQHSMGIRLCDIYSSGCETSLSNIQNRSFLAVYRILLEPLQSTYPILCLLSLVSSTMIPIFCSGRIASNHREST
jgi:hypothetical protein